MYKFHSRDSSKIKVCSPLQLSCSLTGKWHAIGYAIYTKRWAKCSDNSAKPNLMI